MASTKTSCASIEGKGTTAPGQIDFALLTDGLRAEREQGITIDVAYRYFSTARRKFIIADTPGHEQYTRNMATGASTADAAVVLIDATQGRARPIAPARLHRVAAGHAARRGRRQQDGPGRLRRGNLPRHRERFRRRPRSDRAETGKPVEAVFVPVSALVGDNVVHRSQRDALVRRARRCWSCWNRFRRRDDTRTAPFRFPVQRVLRPDHTFRGFAGQIASGTVRPGDTITVLPSGRTAKIERIVTWDGDLEEAHAPLSVTLVLDRELDISRGDLIVSAAAPADRRAQRQGRAGVDGSAAARPQPPLSAQAHQPDCSCICHVGRSSHEHRHAHARAGARRCEMNGIGAVDAAPAASHRCRSVQRESRHRRVHPHRSGNQRHRGRGNGHCGVQRRTRSGDGRRLPGAV